MKGVLDGDRQIVRAQLRGISVDTAQRQTYIDLIATDMWTLAMCHEVGDSETGLRIEGLEKAYSR